MSVFILFLLALNAGILSTLFWIPEEDLGRGYYQLKALIVLGLLALLVAIIWLHPIEPFGVNAALGIWFLAIACLCAFVYYAAVWLQQWRWSRVPAALAMVAVTGALLLGGTTLIPTLTPLPSRQALIVVDLLSASFLLGWSLVTMLLGHWYLISPKLSFRYLTTFCRVLVTAVVFRTLVVGWSLLAAHSVDPFVMPHPWGMLVDLGGQGMFFWFRILWGLAIPFLLALMSLHCARNQSNQSATGILYVLLLGGFIGEITALYLSVTTGVPI
jgi:hypothetical protein